MSVLDKRRQEIKQQDDAEESNVELDGGVESTAAQKEQDKGLTIFRYIPINMFPRNHKSIFLLTEVKLNTFEHRPLKPESSMLIISLEKGGTPI